MSGERYNYKGLLAEDKNLERWYNNLKRSSPANADKSLQRVGYVCRVFNTTTAKMATMTAKEAADLIYDVLSALEKEGKQPTYMQDYVKSLKSWFFHNQIQIIQKFKLPKSKSSTKVSDEQSPTPDQVRRVLNAADQKQKVECTLVGFAGLRPEVVGNYLGDDGLQVRDLPEMKVNHKKKTVEFEKIPTLVMVRENLSKAGHQYITFMPDEGCQYIRELLELRLRRGEKIKPESPIVNSIKYNKHPGHIRTTNIGDSMRTAIRKAGFDWRPYILRTYFDTRMMMAEGDRIIIEDWRVFWMGHKGDIEHVYTLNKKKLPEDLIEQMREAFAKAAEKHLVTTTKREVMSQDLIRAQWNRQFLEMAGYSAQEIDAMGDLSSLTPAQINKLFQEKTKRNLGLNGNTQKVVPLEEVRTHIMDGWEYVRDLPPGDAIIKLPS
ncbi:hypothetical protein [Nitrososphaera sp.]|uniref:hypothetical protein n=1 Tax=Nitrososphaera sp. TaxID=1971748 RepID=UPI0017A92778|nr:hypothetical protein [Nitrososphaera sp.]NWG37845.1 site-specific integrase [Nitrososphaera sp.]